mgnify:CR=1 FL=1
MKKDKEIRGVLVQASETSTTVAHPIEKLAQLTRDREDVLLVVDGITGVGVFDLPMDKWGIDALYSGTQKCLSCPPGLAPVSFSDKAVGKLMSRKTKVPNWYLDLSMITKYWSGKSRVYHHTAPINMLYGLYQACYNILDEGLDNVIERHLQMHQLLAEELDNLRLELFVEESARLPMLNAVKIPEGINDGVVRNKLMNKFHIEIGGGLGPLAGKIWRIGCKGSRS